MKKIIFSIILSLTMLMTSCVTAQTTPSYTRVYYDYVITGVVNEIGFVNDGYYSYHIVGEIPMNVYWELCPCGTEIRLYNRSMIFQRWWTPSQQWIFYNHHRHHVYKPQINHPHNHSSYSRPGYTTPPSHNYRPHTPQTNNHYTHRHQGNHRPNNSTKPNNPHRGRR